MLELQSRTPRNISEMSKQPQQSNTAQERNKNWKSVTFQFSSIANSMNLYIFLI